jgi:hypothetical protein
MYRCRLLTVLLPLVLLGCGAPPYASNWDELRPGMTRSQVTDLLGEPTGRTQIERPGGALVRERWQYGEGSTSTSAGTGLGLTPPQDVFVVTFGADRRVKEFRRPLVGRYAEPQPSVEPPD